MQNIFVIFWFIKIYDSFNWGEGTLWVVNWSDRNGGNKITEQDN